MGLPKIGPGDAGLFRKGPHPTPYGRVSPLLAYPRPHPKFPGPRVPERTSDVSLGRTHPPRLRGVGQDRAGPGRAGPGDGSAP